MEARCLQRSADSWRGHAGNGRSQLCPIRSGAVLHSDFTMSRPAVWLTASDHFRLAVDWSGGPIHASAEELPPIASVFKHRPQRDYGSCSRLWRPAWHPGNVPAYDLSFCDQASAFLLRGKRAATREDGSVPAG